MAAAAKARRDFWPCRTGEPGRSFASDFVGPDTSLGPWTWRPSGSYDGLLLDADCNVFQVMRWGQNGVIKMFRPDLQTVVHSFMLEDVLGTPALAGGVLYAMTATGFAAAFDIKSGQQVWKTQYCKQVAQDPSSAGVCKDVLVLPGKPEPNDPNSIAPVMNDMVYGLGVKDGKRLWEYKPGLVMMGQNFTPAFSEDALMFMDSKADVCCVALKDGKERWKAVPKGLSRSFGGVCAGQHGLAFAAVNRPGKKLWNAPSGGKGAARAYDIKTGSMTWEVEFDLEVHGVPSLLSTGPGGRQVLVIGLGATPGFPEGNSFQAPPTGDEWTAQVVGLDPETGKQLWAGERKVWKALGCRMSEDNKDLTINATTNPVGTGDGTFYVVWQGYLFHCNVEDGSERSCHDLMDIVQANPVVAPGVLVIAGAFARTCVFRAMPYQRGKVVRPLDAPLEQTGEEHFWNAKHGPDMSHQGFAKCKAPRSLKKPTTFFKYGLLYAHQPRHSDDNFYNSPAVDSQRNVYINANFSDLFIIRPDGRLRGSVHTGPLASTPVLLGKACYIVDGAGFAHSFDIETLALNWRERYCVSNPWDSWSAAGKGDALVVGGNTDYRTNGATHLYRLSTADGKTVWKFHFEMEPQVMPYNMMPAITDDGRVICACQYGFVYCINLENGELFWRVEDPGAPGGFTTATVTAAPCGLVANTWNIATPLRWNKNQGGVGKLDIFDWKTGQKKVERVFGYDVNVAPLFIPPESATGSAGWQVVVCLGSNPGPPEDHHEPVSGDAWQGLMLALSAETGEDIWSWAPPVTRHFTFRGSDAKDWYLPDSWTSVSADSTGTIYGSFHDGVMYAVRGGELISKFDMRSCGNCAPGIAPGLVTHANQFGLIIWRDAEIEEEWAASGDKRAVGGQLPGGPVPDKIAHGGPWDEGDGRLEWFSPRAWEEPKDKKATAEDLEDHKRWLEESEKLEKEALAEVLAWSDARRAERAAVIKAAAKSKPAAPKMAGQEGSVWTVVGGGSQGGIVARNGEGLKSPELGRLSTGATVEEMELKGERLHYKKLTGDGPDFGWVSLSFKGTPLVRRQA